MPFNIGPGELILILIIALVVLGPGKLPDVAASLGKSVREFRKAATDISDAGKMDAPATAPATAPASTAVTQPVQLAPTATPAPAAPAAEAAPVAAAPAADGAAEPGPASPADPNPS